MSDQYDDGRYDRLPEEELELMQISPELNFVRAHPFTVQRGGIKYPKPKGTTMTLTPKQKVRKLEAELDKNLDLQHVLQLRADDLRAEIKKVDIPNPPPRGAGDMFVVSVQFAPHGQHYTYLLTRSGVRWYTTGTKEDQKMFPSWEALCAWLETTHWHSNLGQLAEVGARKFPTRHNPQPPF